MDHRASRSSRNRDQPPMKRRADTKNNTQSHPSKPALELDKRQCTSYRVRPIPNTFDQASFHDALCVSLQLEQDIKLIVQSFASNGPEQRTATITFTGTPSRLSLERASQIRGKETEWTINLVHPLSEKLDEVYIDTHFKGFTPVSPLVNDEEHLIDCIAIHGLGSHALGGFRANNDTYVWLRDSLPRDVPQLRVSIYGYSCDLTADDSISGVDDYADIFRRLLRVMPNRNKTGPSVPLVFIVHSLGGMVLKQAIIMMSKSSNSKDQRNLRSIYGALFFGVPNQGMDTKALAAMIGNKPQRYDLSLLDHEVGHRLRSGQHTEFCKAFSFEDSKIRYFFETKKTPTVVENKDKMIWTSTGPETLLVNHTSATYGRQLDASQDSNIPINANHRDMVKFSRSNTDDYMIVLEELQDLVDQASIVIERRFQDILINTPSSHRHERKKISALDEESIQEDLACLQSLAFPEMKHRRLDMQRAHTNTCHWITSHPSYTTFLEQRSGILWIKGKPGSGKSTLMGFLLQHFEKQPIYRESINISFFFHGRGTALQKSRLGMYRSLLHQLLLVNTSAQAEIRHDFRQRSRSEGNHGKDWDWHTNELYRFFMSALEHVVKTKPVNIFVDALDEASDDSDCKNLSRQIVQDFHAINDILHYKLQSMICFSCRHFPVISENKGRDICVEEENQEDIELFVCDELQRSLSPSKSEEEYVVEMQDTIIRRAQGVFQWAALAVDLTIRYHLNGLSQEKIAQMLTEVPDELGAVYKHILTKVIDKKNHRQALRLMRWVYLAERPLTVTEISYAMNIPDTEIFSTECTFKELEFPKDSLMVKQIGSVSGGLIECKEHEDGQLVQFIHQSVNDFILRDGFRFFNSASPRDPIGQGHHHLSLICANYIKTIEIDISYESNIQYLENLLPFVGYAAKYWFLHAEKAETLGVPQDYLLQYCQYCPRAIDRWVVINTILNFRQHWDPKTMLHIASRVGLSSVVEGLLLEKVNIEQMDGRENGALHYAAHWGHIKVVRALLDAGAWPDRANSYASTPLAEAAGSGHEEVARLLLKRGASIYKKTQGVKSVLYRAAEKGSRATVQLLLDNNAKVNAQGGLYGNSLQAATYMRHQATVQLLLDNNARVNAQGGIYGNALQAAALSGDQEIVQLLLNHGADVNTQGGKYGNALQAAAYNGSQKIVQLLLNYRADVNTQGGEFGSVLQAAAYNYNQEIVQLLLNYGADVNTQGGEYENALQAAAFKGNQEIVQLLLNYGADVNTQGGKYGNALQAATYNGSQKIVQLLLNYRADVNTQGGEFGSVLQAAVLWPHRGIVRLLLEANADIHCLDQELKLPHNLEGLGIDEQVDILCKAERIK